MKNLIGMYTALYPMAAKSTFFFPLNTHEEFVKVEQTLCHKINESWGIWVVQS